MACHRAIVWIDEVEACILKMDGGLEHEFTIPVRVGSEPTAREEDGAAGGYFHRVARALDLADEILIVGPSSTKLEFQQFLNKNDHAIDPRILGVETIPHHTDAQLAAFAKLYFTTGGPRRGGNGSSRNT